MTKEDINGLKYYIIYAVLVISLFVYSGMTGWKWFNPTKTEPTRPIERTGHIYRYHK